MGLVETASVVFGGVYGYGLKDKKYTSGELWKFFGIMAPLSVLHMYSYDFPNRPIAYPQSRLSPSYNIVKLATGPVMTGWFLCIGSSIGKMARKVVDDA